jgi:hypothetical protein
MGPSKQRINKQSDMRDFISMRHALAILLLLFLGLFGWFGNDLHQYRSCLHMFGAIHASAVPLESKPVLHKPQPGMVGWQFSVRLRL